MTTKTKACTVCGVAETPETEIRDRIVPNHYGQDQKLDDACADCAHETWLSLNF